MTNTYDTSNFLPCPFCGAKPKAIDWPGGPMAKVFIHCPNDNYDSEDGGCSVGPDVVGSDMEDAAARWNRRQSQQAQGEAQGFTDYDAGALNDWGGGDVGWWQDYIRSEIERANDHWREQTGPEPLYLAPPAPAAVPEGWHISRTEDGKIIVQKSHVAGFVASEESGGIAESTLYYLADDLLTASANTGHIGDGNEMVFESTESARRVALNFAHEVIWQLFRNHQHKDGVDGLLNRVKKAADVIAAELEAPAHTALLRQQEEAER